MGVCVCVREMGLSIKNLRLKQLQLYIVFNLLFSPNIPTLVKVTPSISMENVSTQSPNCVTVCSTLHKFDDPRL